MWFSALCIHYHGDYHTDTGGGGMCMRSDRFWVLDVIDIVLYRNNTCNCIEYNIPIKPHKTRRQSYAPFLKYGLDNSGSGLKDDL